MAYLESNIEKFSLNVRSLMPKKKDPIYELFKLYETTRDIALAK
jgi:hypothetical protein